MIPNDGAEVHLQAEARDHVAADPYGATFFGESSRESLVKPDEEHGLLVFATVEGIFARWSQGDDRHHTVLRHGDAQALRRRGRNLGDGG